MYYVYQLCIPALKEWLGRNCPLESSDSIASSHQGYSPLWTAFVSLLWLNCNCHRHAADWGWYPGQLALRTSCKYSMHAGLSGQPIGAAFQASHFGGALVLVVVTHWVEWDRSSFGEPRECGQVVQVDPHPGRSVWC